MHWQIEEGYIMLKLTKSNVTYATKQGLDLCIDEEQGTVLIHVQGEDDNLLEYRFNEDGSLYYYSQVYGNKIEDLPAHINNSKQFNQVIKYIGSQLETL
jgi:predicted AlkP superfamily phosphohydrolase/phosphomutase